MAPQAAKQGTRLEGDAFEFLTAVPLVQPHQFQAEVDGGITILAVLVHEPLDERAINGDGRQSAFERRENPTLLDEMDGSEPGKKRGAYRGATTGVVLRKRVG